MLSQKSNIEDDENLYRSDSDESLRQYRLSHHVAPPPRPQSTLSLNQLCSRRSSNPDIYPGARRFSTSYSHEDILSNDQLDQIHFDPRYRDYRSASSLNYSYNRSRSNSLNSVGSGNIQYQQFRRMSNYSPPLIAPLVHQKRWDTNPSIFIEEYHDEPKTEPKSESRSDRSVQNSKETICSSNESLIPLSEGDIKSLGDLSQIPFIDDDSNESAPCRFLEDDFERKSCMPSSTQRPCRKTVSFDVIAGGPASSTARLFTSNGKNFPKFPNSIPNPTDKNQLLFRANVRSSRDGINRFPQQHTSVPRSSTCDDHCTLVDKLIRLRLEECRMLPMECRVKKPTRVCEGKVKALTTYFNSLPYMTDDCNCTKIHRSTPDLRDKLTFEEMEAVRRKLKEYSEFGLKKQAPCMFPVTCRENEEFSNCKEYRRKLDKVQERRKKSFHQSMSDLHCCKSSPHHHHCHEKVLHVPPPSEKHRCRSACFNVKDPVKQKRKKEAKAAAKLFSADDDNDNESFVI
jgi:hypothetical protein